MTRHPGTPDNAQGLTGITVVVTRPVKQAAGLCQLIESRGGKAICFPTLEIGPAAKTEHLQTLLDQLEQFDMAIFVSANAVSGAAGFIGDTLPESLTLAAVGQRTAKAIHEHWQRQAICPAAEANSETLLAMPEMRQVTGKKIVIFRGNGGRELLAETLTQRGAQVEYAEVYRRTRPNAELSALQQQAPIDISIIITATSNESLQNLYDMASSENREWLLSLPLAVISQRTATLAKQLGFKHPAIIAKETGDEGLLNAIILWKERPEDPHH